MIRLSRERKIQEKRSKAQNSAASHGGYSSLIKMTSSTLGAICSPTNFGVLARVLLVKTAIKKIYMLCLPGNRGSKKLGINHPHHRSAALRFPPREPRHFDAPVAGFLRHPSCRQRRGRVYVQCLHRGATSSSCRPRHLAR